MRGAVPVQDLPRPIVEHDLHPLDLRAGHLPEPCPLVRKRHEKKVSDEKKVSGTVLRSEA
jgi:hypothetical protein